MSITRQNLRIEIGEDLSLITTSSTASGSATTMQAPALIDALESEEMHKGDWVWMDNVIGTTWDERRVLSYDPATGIITFSRAWSEARAAGLQYEIWRYIKPSEVNDIIDRALERLSYVYRQAITVVDGQRNYTLAAYTWLTEARQVMNVYWQTGDAAAEYSYQPLAWYQVQDRAGTIYLDTYPYTAVSGDTMFLEAWRVYDAFDDDDDTTDCPKEWVKSLAKLRIYQRMMRNAPAEDAARWRAQAAAEALQFRSLCKRYTPQVKARTQLPGSPRHGGLNSSIVTW